MCKENHVDHRGGEGHCLPPGGGVRGIVQPWLLLLLAQKPTHGYELMERLGQDENTPSVDPGLLYRTLRQFEQAGLVCSSWDTRGGGPARRVYQITDEGIDYLHAWAVKIRKIRKRMDRFFTEYQAHFQKEEEQFQHF
jgi:poly-beta-hydroxybutyrate-responsive repressor